MALSEDDKDRLFRHWKTIKNNVEMRYIIDLLIEERVISPDEWEDMKKSHQLEKDRTEAFLHWLLKQSEKSYDAFLKALHNGKYDFISEKLDRNMQRNHPLTDLSTQLGGKNG
ncbi:hypothetical protein ACJMK2_017119 [Sinanodonta woodiana]|uniref:CARD domain-containing protein n=1 Tax=Sinanodonta woodiana TaxID=1069815 RepID=A0ABD3UZ77_SINWO